MGDMPARPPDTLHPYCAKKGKNIMKNFRKRFTAWLLIVTLVFCMMPVNVWADEIAGDDSSYSESSADTSESADTGADVADSDETSSEGTDESAADVDSDSNVDSEADVDDESNIDDEADVDDESNVDSEADVDDESNVDDEADVDDESNVDNEADVDDEADVDNESNVGDNNNVNTDDAEADKTDEVDTDIVVDEDKVIDEDESDAVTPDKDKTEEEVADDVVKNPEENLDGVVIAPEQKEPEQTQTPEQKLPEVNLTPDLKLPELDKLVEQPLVPEKVACSGDESCLAEEHNEGCPKFAPQLPIVPVLSPEVQAFWDAVAQLPESVTLENADEVLALVEACWEAYEVVPAEFYEQEAFVAALTKLQSLMEAAALLVETTEWTYSVEEPMETKDDNFISKNGLLLEDRKNIADNQLLELFENCKIQGAAPYGIYKGETYVIPVDGNTGLEKRLVDGGFRNAKLSASGTHKLYISDSAAQHVTPSWKVEKSEDGTVVVNGIEIVGIEGSEKTFNLLYVHYPMNSEDPDVVFGWKVFIADNPESPKADNTIPVAPGDAADYFWYGTEKPAYERVFTKGGKDQEVVSMVMAPMKNSSYDWSPDSTTWTAAGDHNYSVVYCAEVDKKTNPDGEKYRIGKVIEESSFNKNTQDALRAVIENGYPFLSADEMNYRMGTNYDTAILTAGTQYAVWAITDGVHDEVTSLATKLTVPKPFINGNHIYIPSSGGSFITLSPSDTLHSETAIYSFVTSSVSGNSEAAKAIEKVKNYLLSCNASELQTDFKIAEAKESFSRNEDGSYNVTVTGELNREAGNFDNELEKVAVTLTDGINTVMGTVEGKNFTVSMENIPASSVITLKAVASLADRMQVYYYTSDTGYYQNFIGGNIGTSTTEDSKEFIAPKEPEIKTGDLTITKQIVGGGDLAAAKEYHFTVTGPNDYQQKVSITGAGSVTLSELQPGTYNVTEENAAIDGYTWSVEGNGNVLVIAEKNAEITITNSYQQIEPKKGSLSVAKKVVVDGGELTDVDTSTDFNFTIKLSDSTVDGVYGDITFVAGVAEITLHHGERKTAVGLPAGVDYTVTEKETADYIADAVEKTGVITEDGAEVEFTNTRTVTPPTQPTPPTPVIPENPENPGNDDPGSDDSGDDDPIESFIPTIPLDQPPVPLTETPVEELILNEDVPLSGLPEDEEVLLDEEVPLAKVPKTGDNLVLWFFAALASGLAALGLSRKRG